MNGRKFLALDLVLVARPALRPISPAVSALLLGDFSANRPVPVASDTSKRGWADLPGYRR